MSTTLRAQLIEAIEALQRQIEVLQSPATPAGVVGCPDNGALIRELEDEIRQLSEALASLPDGA